MPFLSVQIQIARFIKARLIIAGITFMEVIGHRLLAQYFGSSACGAEEPSLSKHSARITTPRRRWIYAYCLSVMQRLKVVAPSAGLWTSLQAQSRTVLTDSLVRHCRSTPRFDPSPRPMSRSALMALFPLTSPSTSLMSSLSALRLIPALSSSSPTLPAAVQEP